jgi:hypothetical protein
MLASKNRVRRCIVIGDKACRMKIIPSNGHSVQKIAF